MEGDLYILGENKETKLKHKISVEGKQKEFFFGEMQAKKGNRGLSGREGQLRKKEKQGTTFECQNRIREKGGKRLPGFAKIRRRVWRGKLERV